jgi:hypothetical protein
MGFDAYTNHRAIRSVFIASSPMLDALPQVVDPTVAGRRAKAVQKSRR